VKQGFAWRPGCVAFSTLDEGGSSAIEVFVSEAIDISPDVIRVIETPFQVSEAGSIGVATVVDHVLLNVPPGQSFVRYECFPITDDGRLNVRLVFNKTENPAFQILRADPEITICEHLLTTAEPA